MFINISNVKITIEAPAVFEAYLKNDFGIFEAEEGEAPDILIRIRNQVYVPAEKKSYQITARDHTTVFTCARRDKAIYIELYVPYHVKNVLLEMLGNPFFMPKWQRCLVDFFHNPFLGILQMELLARGATFLHAAAYCKSPQDGVVLVGDGQSGKSTILKWMSKEPGVSVMSEDFCIVNETGSIAAYPKQSRVTMADLKETAYYKKSGRAYAFWDRLNVVLFSALGWLGVPPKRRLAFEEVFAGCPFAKEAKLSCLVFLKREGEEPELEPCECEAFAELCAGTMQTEFENLAVFLELLTDMGKNLEGLLAEFKAALLPIISQKECKIARIPFYTQKAQAECTVPRFLLGEL